MDAGIGEENELNLLYRVDTDEIFLRALDGENWIGPCTSGEMNTLSNGNVEINCQETVPTSKAEKFIILSFSTRWTQPIDTPILMDVLLRATDRNANDRGGNRLCAVEARLFDCRSGSSGHRAVDHLATSH